MKWRFFIYFSLVTKVSWFIKSNDNTYLFVNFTPNELVYKFQDQIKTFVLVQSNLTTFE